MKLLIPSFPRQLAYPNRVTCNDRKDFISSINRLNGVKKKLYFSLYRCNERGQFDSTEIDKIAFDIDSSRSVENVKKLFLYCELKSLKCLALFSTNGFWFYIFTKNFEQLKNKKDALANAQQDIAKQCGFKIGDDPHADDVDYHIIGDIARIARLPNSYDVDRKRYCIPVTKEDLELGYEHIVDKSKKQCFDFEYYGDQLFDISDYDYISSRNIYNIDIPKFDYDFEVTDELLKVLPPCVLYHMKNTPLKGHNKYWVWITIALKEFGFSITQTKQLLKPILEKIVRTDGYGKNEWQHYTQHDHLPESAYERDYDFPSCNSLWVSGFCKGKCRYYGKIYK